MKTTFGLFNPVGSISSRLLLLLLLDTTPQVLSQNAGQFSCDGRAYITQIMGSLGNVIDSLQFRCSDGKLSHVFGNGDNGAKWELPPDFSGIRHVTVGGSRYLRTIQQLHLEVTGSDMDGGVQHFQNTDCPFNSVSVQSAQSIGKLVFQADCQRTGKIPSYKTESKLTELQGTGAGFIRSLYCAPGTFVTQINGRSDQTHGVIALQIKCSDGSISDSIGGFWGNFFTTPEKPRGITRLSGRASDRLNAIGTEAGNNLGNGGGTDFTLSYNEGQSECVLGGIVFRAALFITQIAGSFRCPDVLKNNRPPTGTPGQSANPNYPAWQPPAQVSRQPTQSGAVARAGARN